MTLPPVQPTQYSDACFLCGAQGDARTPRNVDVALAPVRENSTVVGTVHWECLLSRLHGVGCVAGPDPFVARFGPPGPRPFRVDP